MVQAGTHTFKITTVDSPPHQRLLNLLSLEHLGNKNTFQALVKGGSMQSMEDPFITCKMELEGMGISLKIMEASCSLDQVKIQTILSLTDLGSMNKGHLVNLLLIQA